MIAQYVSIMRSGVGWWDWGCILIMRLRQDYGFLHCINRAKIMSAGGGYSEKVSNQGHDFSSQASTSGQSVLIGVCYVETEFVHDRGDDRGEWGVRFPAR